MLISYHLPAVSFLPPLLLLRIQPNHRKKSFQKIWLQWRWCHTEENCGATIARFNPEPLTNSWHCRENSSQWFSQSVHSERVEGVTSEASHKPLCLCRWKLCLCRWKHCFFLWKLCLCRWKLCLCRWELCLCRWKICLLHWKNCLCHWEL